LPELDGIFTLDQRKVGIMRPQPLATLHVGGGIQSDGSLTSAGMTVTGPLTVTGAMVFNGTVSGTAIGEGAGQIAAGDHSHPNPPHDHSSLYVDQVGDTMSGKLGIVYSSPQGIGDAGGSQGHIELGQTGAGAAKIAFHRHGAFAAYFGIDTDNQWAVGGWSMGATRSVLITDNQTQTMSNKTHSGHFNITGGYIFVPYVNTPADVAAGVPTYVAGNNGDNYIRWYPRGVLVPSQQSYSHSLSCTANGNWNIATINGALATTWLNNQSSHFIVKPGVFAIYGTVNGYNSTGFRIYTDGALRLDVGVGVPEWAGGIGGGWVGQVNSSIQFYCRANTTFSGNVVVTWVPTPGAMS